MNMLRSRGGEGRAGCDWCSVLTCLGKVNQVERRSQDQSLIGFRSNGPRGKVNVIGDKSNLVRKVWLVELSDLTFVG